ncbi:MAG: aspartyl protease family protein [Candidatus Cyclobacteriaceae bacterium M3_2C_046]
MKLFYRILFYATIITLSYQAVFADTYGFNLTGSNQHKANIVFKKINNLIVIPVYINQQEKPLNFILDTGIRSMVLFKKKYARQLNLEFEREIMFSGVGGNNKVSGLVSNNVVVNIPGIEGKGISIVTLQKGFNELTDLNIHGAMGYQIFSRFIVEINYHASIITLYEADYFLAESNYTSTDLILDDTQPYVQAAMNFEGQQIKGKFLIDTGFNSQVLLFLNDDHPFKNNKLSYCDNYTGVGLAGRVKGLIHQKLVLELGDWAVSEINTVIPYKNSFADKSRLKGRMGIIGGELLSRFSVIIDYINAKLYFKPHQGLSSVKPRSLISQS